MSRRRWFAFRATQPPMQGIYKPFRRQLSRACWASRAPPPRAAHGSPGAPVAGSLPTSNMNSGITVDVVSKAAGFDALHVDWDRLVDRMEVPSPFLTWDWNRAWWATFGGRKQMRVAVLRDEDQVVGIAPFYRVGFWPLHALGPIGWPERLTEQM